MTDGVVLNAVTVGGGQTVDTETNPNNSRQMQRVKVVLGATDTDGGDVSSSNAMPVSLASLPALPTGANTIGKIDILGNAGATIDSAAGTPNAQAITVQGNASGVAIPVSWSGQSVGVSSLPALTTGANTIGAVTQASGPWTSNITQIGGSALAFGQSTKSSSIPVSMPSDVTASITVAPTNTNASSYGTNYVLGGLLTFSNAFGAAGSGVVEAIHVTGKKAYTTSLKLYLFNANPSNTTWTDAAAAAINAADVTKVVGVYFLSPDNGLGTHAIWNLDSIGKAVSVGSTTLYGVLVTTAALSAATGSTTDFTVTVTTMKD